MIIIIIIMVLTMIIIVMMMIIIIMVLTMMIMELTTAFPVVFANMFCASSAQQNWVFLFHFHCVFFLAK